MEWKLVSPVALDFPGLPIACPVVFGHDPGSSQPGSASPLLRWIAAFLEQSLREQRQMENLGVLWVPAVAEPLVQVLVVGLDQQLETVDQMEKSGKVKTDVELGVHEEERKRLAWRGVELLATVQKQLEMYQFCLCSSQQGCQEWHQLQLLEDYPGLSFRQFELACGKEVFPRISQMPGPACLGELLFGAEEW